MGVIEDAFRKVLALLRKDKNVELVRCKRCHRPLKTTQSMARGYGPTCYAKVKKQQNQGTPLFVVPTREQVIKLRGEKK